MDENSAEVQRSVQQRSQFAQRFCSLDGVMCNGCGHASTGQKIDILTLRHSAIKHRPLIKVIADPQGEEPV